jgi:hypothetical protein
VIVVEEMLTAGTGPGHVLLRAFPASQVDFVGVRNALGRRRPTRRRPPTARCNRSAASKSSRTASTAETNRRDKLHDKALERCRQFFVALQQSGRDWLLLGTTKTGLVYRLKKNPPQSHE